MTNIFDMSTRDIEIVSGGTEIVYQESVKRDFPVIDTIFVEMGRKVNSNFKLALRPYKF